MLLIVMEGGGVLVKMLRNAKMYVHWVLCYLNFFPTPCFIFLDGSP